MSKKYFEVEITYIAVVEAEDMADAYSVAESEKREILWDGDGDVSVVGEVKSLKRLPCGWDADCLPYGGDGESRLKDLLPETEPARDTKTIDMFAGAQQ